MENENRIQNEGTQQGEIAEEKEAVNLTSAEEGAAENASASGTEANANQPKSDEKISTGATEFTSGSFSSFEEPYRPYQPMNERQSPSGGAYQNQNQGYYDPRAQYGAPPYHESGYANQGANQGPYGGAPHNAYAPYGTYPYGQSAPFGDGLYRSVASTPRVSPLIKVLAWVSFGLSIFAAFLSFIFAVASTEPGFNGAVAALVCSLFPVAALVFGIIMAKKRAGGTKFIIVGAITLSFSLLFALVAALVASVNTEYPEAEAEIQVAEVEQLLGIDLPEYYDYDSEECAQLYGDSYYENTYYTEDIGAMRMLVTEDSRFMMKLPNSYIGMLPEESRDDYAPSAILFYNEDDGTFNTLPRKNGTYNMLCIRYYDYDYEAYYVITEYELYYVSDLNTGDF